MARQKASEASCPQSGLHVVTLPLVTLWHIGAASQAAAPLLTLVQVFSHPPVALLKEQYGLASQPEALLLNSYLHWRPHEPWAYWQRGWASQEASDGT